MLLPLRLIREVRFGNLLRFVWVAGLGNLRAITRFAKQRKKGLCDPAFLFISVTQRCNLTCRGCWATGIEGAEDMSPALLESILARAEAKGVRFFGILGGEPLLTDGLPERLAAHKNSYFLLFTNGTLIDAAMAERLSRAGNITPLINTAAGAEEAITRCRDAGLVTGAAWAFDKSNLQLASSQTIDRLVALGAHYVWPYIYRPSGPDPHYELALDDADVIKVRQFIVDERKRNDVVVLDAYWNHKGEPLCPGAVGISVHITVKGEVEPCPPVQMSDSLYGGASLWLNRFQTEVPRWTNGCPLMDHPKELLALAEDCAAHDSSGRGTFKQECAGRPCLTCHNHAGPPIPEKYFAYKIAKKYWFFGFGAYG